MSCVLLCEYNWDFFDFVVFIIVKEKEILDNDL